MVNGDTYSGHGLMSSDKDCFDIWMRTFRSCRWELKSQTGKWALANNLLEKEGF